MKGDLLLAVSTADYKVHSTIRLRNGFWTPFDEVTSPARGGGQVSRVSVMSQGGVVVLNDPPLSFAVLGSTGWTAPMLVPWNGAAGGPVATIPVVSPRSDFEFAAMGLGYPTGLGFPYGLPLVQASTQYGYSWTFLDILWRVDAGALSPSNTWVDFDLVGHINLAVANDWFLFFWLVTGAGELYEFQQIATGDGRYPFQNGNVLIPIGGVPPALKGVSVANEQICVLDRSGTIWRAFLGSGPFDNVNAAAGGGATRFSQVAISSYIEAGEGGRGPVLHVAAVDDGGNVFHAIRQFDGTWTPFVDVKRATGIPQFPDIGFVTSVDIDVQP
jgi:hypothetical protein